MKQEAESPRKVSKVKKKRSSTVPQDFIDMMKKFGFKESRRICVWSDDESLLLMLIFHLLFVVSGMRRSSTFASHLCLKYIWKGILPYPGGIIYKNHYEGFI